MTMDEQERVPVQDAKQGASKWLAESRLSIHLVLFAIFCSEFPIPAKGEITRWSIDDAHLAHRPSKVQWSDAVVLALSCVGQGWGFVVEPIPDRPWERKKNWQSARSSHKCLHSPLLSIGHLLVVSLVRQEAVAFWLCFAWAFPYVFLL